MLFSIASSAIPAFTKIDLKKNSNLLQQTASPSVQSQDRFSPINPGDVALEGFLGERCRKNERARLLAKNEDELLQGFQKRPGKQAWIGEHAGKWLHAATLAWVYTKDPYLRSKLDRVAAELIAAQKDDGYLGTYSDNAHFGMGNNEQWDVWVHKYNLIGLITYHTYTGDKNALKHPEKSVSCSFGHSGSLNRATESWT